MSPVNLGGAAFWAFLAGEDRMLWRTHLLKARRDKAMRGFHLAHAGIYRRAYRRNLERALQ